MDINTYLAKLNYQPIDTLPWDEWEACDGDTMRDMPVGIVLRDIEGATIIIGDGMGGLFPPGAEEARKQGDNPDAWYDLVGENWDHWAWIWDVKE